MKTAIHSVAPEEVMAFLDGELAPAEAQAVSAHLDHCAECAGLADKFRATSESLGQWTVPPAPSSLQEAVMSEAACVAAGHIPAKPRSYLSPSLWGWKQWALGGGGVMAVGFLLLVASSTVFLRPRVETVRTQPYIPPQSATEAMLQDKPASPASFGAAQSEARLMNSLETPSAPPIVTGKAVGAIYGSVDKQALAATPPMIVRTGSLTIIVKDLAISRASLDSILARHRGYAAQLTVLAQGPPPYGLTASLRIPSPELAYALADLKALGRVEKESQSGEEVTQQHADLVARLQNSRETEERLRAILAQRTGKIEDVLQVEEEIARVRGEIEQMESEQQALEHRVEFASVELQLVEEYKAQLNPPSASVPNRIRNAFVAGLSSAAETILGIVLFLEEDGPVLLIWLAILGLPVFLLVRRYRRARAEF